MSVRLETLHLHHDLILHLNHHLGRRGKKTSFSSWSISYMWQARNCWWTPSHSFCSTLSPNGCWAPAWSWPSPCSPTPPSICPSCQQRWRVPRALFYINIWYLVTDVLFRFMKKTLTSSLLPVLTSPDPAAIPTWPWSWTLSNTSSCSASGTPSPSSWTSRTLSTIRWGPR